jgi:hypothetical protein
MIVFDLKCAGGHVFEAWFGSSGDYEGQRAGGLLSCPICGDGAVEKAVMAPNVAAKGNSRQTVTPAEAKAMMAALARAQAKALEGSQWVGTAFADKARAMHLGDEPTAPIHGQTSLSEAKALADEGVPIAPLRLPVTPAETQN